MASKLGLMVKREEAETRLEHAVNRLRRRGVDPGSEPDRLRDPDAQTVRELNRVADILDAAIARIDELQARIESVEAERDAAINALNASIADPNDAPKPRDVETVDPTTAIVESGGAAAAEAIARATAEDPAAQNATEPIPVHPKTAKGRAK